MARVIIVLSTFIRLRSPTFYAGPGLGFEYLLASASASENLDRLTVLGDSRLTRRLTSRDRRRDPLLVEHDLALGRSKERELDRPDGAVPVLLCGHEFGSRTGNLHHRNSTEERPVANDLDIGVVA